MSAMSLVASLMALVGVCLILWDNCRIERRMRELEAELADLKGEGDV